LSATTVAIAATGSSLTVAFARSAVAGHEDVDDGRAIRLSQATENVALQRASAVEGRSALSRIICVRRCSTIKCEKAIGSEK